VIQCNDCGAELPDDARYCLNCGASTRPNATEPPSEQPLQPAGPPPELDFVQPALAGGAFLGVLSSLPLIAAGNCLCCMWVLGGGGLATFLLTKQQPGRRLNYGDGAFAGVLSGLFGAIIATIIWIPIKLMSARFMESQQESIENILRNMPELQGQWRDLFMRLMSPEVSGTTVLLTFVSNLIVYSLFAMVGGILTVAILNRKGGGLQPPPRQGI